MVVYKNKEWLAHFKTIDAVKPEIIKDCLLKIKIDQGAKFPSFYRKTRKHAYVCELDEAIKIIIDNFEKEIRFFEKKRDDLSRLMDFVVQPYEFEDGTKCLAFDIRLHHVTKPGNIYYGLNVTRPNENKFVLKY